MASSLTPEILVYGFEIPNDPQIAPDGSAIAYVLAKADPESKKNTTQIWLCDLGGDKRRRLTWEGENNGNPRWSPDSQRIAFVSDRVDKDKSGLFVMNLAGGDARELTRHLKGISHISWSPDGSQIAYTTRFDPDNPDEEERPEDAAPPVRATRRIDYKQDGQGYLGDVRSQIFVIDAEGGERRKLTERAVDYVDIKWSPDGKTIGAIVPGKNGLNARLALIDVDIGKERVFGPETGFISSWSWSPDGERIVFTGDSWQSHSADFFLFNTASGEITRVTDDFRGEPSGGDPIWLDDERVIFNAEESAASGLYEMKLSTGEEELLFTEAAFRQGSSIDAAKRHLVQIRQSLESNSELWVYDLETGSGRTISDYSAAVLAEHPVGDWERFEIKRAGQTIDAWLLKPPGFDESKAYPVVLGVHGGPNGFFGHQFNPRLHVMASAGFLTVFANPRGSTTYGRDFTQLVTEDWGGEDFQDLMAVVDAVLERPYADEQRTGIYGYSYGGYMTAWTVGQTDRFKAAVCGAPCFDLESMYGTSDISHEFGHLQWGGAPHDAEEMYKKHSPSTYAHQAVTPTLIIQGEADERCPVGQAEQMFVSLLKAGCEAELVRYPGGAHGFPVTGPPEHREDFLKRHVEWFVEHIGTAD